MLCFIGLVIDQLAVTVMLYVFLFYLTGQLRAYFCRIDKKILQQLRETAK